MPNRTAILALVSPTGTPLGTLPPLAVDTPWWQQVDDIVDAARDAFGVRITVLRLLGADREPGPGGTVTYLAECAGPVPAALRQPPGPVDWTDPEPLRMPWARPGGPAASLAWAGAVLAGHGRTLTGAGQVRTWNLSSIWRLDTDRGPAWLKEVPPFLAHEPAVLRWLDRPTVPTVLGAADGRMVLDHIPGADGYDAGPADRRAILAELLDIQAGAVDRVAELLDLGVPDRRAAALGRAADGLLATDHGLDRDERRRLGDLVAGLPDRLADVAGCGVPDTLAHGDFHPGNARVDGGRRVIIDWGDSGIGHPGFDLLRLTGWPGGDPAAERAAWCAHWRRVIPGCDPDRTLDLLAPVVGLAAALTYAAFLAAIEPAERPYHRADVPDRLRAAIAAMSE